MLCPALCFMSMCHVPCLSPCAQLKTQLIKPTRNNNKQQQQHELDELPQVADPPEVLDFPWVTAYAFVVVDRDRAHGRTTWDVDVGDCYLSHSHHPSRRYLQSTTSTTMTIVNSTLHDGGMKRYHLRRRLRGRGNEVGGIGSGRGWGGAARATRFANDTSRRRSATVGWRIVSLLGQT
jgi:hypothetical protein